MIESAIYNFFPFTDLLSAGIAAHINRPDNSIPGINVIHSTAERIVKFSKKNYNPKTYLTVRFLIKTVRSLCNFIRVCTFL